MINKYKNISIIYGGSGRECALLMEDTLNKRHQEERFPVKPRILAKEILTSASIMDTVKSIILSSAACIIILTFDDMDNSRVRQNVLIETGMALTLIDKENCFFISERKTLPDDFPSDLQGVVNPNYYDKNDLQSIVDKTCDEIIHHLELSSYKDILKNGQYSFDYKKVLDDIPVRILEEKADIQLEHILLEWQKNISSFEFVSERIMYLVERIKFFPDFNNNIHFFQFMKNVSDLIRPREYELSSSTPFQRAVCEFINNILEYTRIKLDKDVMKCIASPEKYRVEAMRYHYQFEEIAEKIKRFIDSFEIDETCFCNWMLRIMAYEYVALASMKSIACENRYDEHLLDKMNFIISCYEKVIEVGNSSDIYSSILWEGYAQYDLTRAYENMYRITKDDQYIKKIRDYSIRSINTRHKWFRDNCFKGVFSSALSYEYFLVYKHEYELQSKLEHYTNAPKEDIIDGLETLKSELNCYCESTEIGRLFDVRDEIDHLMTGVRNR